MGLTGNILWGGGTAPVSAGKPVSDIVYAALRKAGVLTVAGRLYSASQLSDAVHELNRMLGSWSTLRTAIHSLAIRQWQTTPSHNPHTLGPGGDWDGPRPVKIVHANVVVGGARYLVDVDLGSEEYASIAIPGATGMPSKLYNDRAAELARVYLYPAPGASYTLELFCWEPLPQFTAPEDRVVLPDGYEDAIVNNLALRLAGIFPDARPSPLLPDWARESLARIRSLNAPSPVMQCDYGVAVGRPFDIIAGE